MASKKTEIIEALFRERWDENTLSLRQPLVTLIDIGEGIRDYNKEHPEHPVELSDRNIANFFKDFIRRKRTANRNWPAYVLGQGFTGHQVTSLGQCFEFYPLAEAQQEPFPLTLLPPSDSTTRHRIETTSMPVASRLLGSTHETWLMNVLARLRVIETHFALYSPRSAAIIQVDQLLMNVKGSLGEMDGLYMVTEERQDGRRGVLVTLEAKGKGEDIIEEQVLSQVKSCFNLLSDLPPMLTDIDRDVVVALAVKAWAPSEIHVMEFEAVERAQLANTESVVMAKDVVYLLNPKVPGIGEGKRSRHRR